MGPKKGPEKKKDKKKDQIWQPWIDHEWFELFERFEV